MVGCQDDEGLIVEAAGAERIEEPLQLAVRIGDFAVVQMASVFCVERFRRVVRTVRIVKM